MSPPPALVMTHQGSGSSYATAQFASLVKKADFSSPFDYCEVRDTSIAAFQSVSDYWDAKSCALRQGWESLAEAVAVRGHGWQARIHVDGSTIMSRGATKDAALRTLGGRVVDHITEPQW